jgi:hypothetical protein
MRTMQAAMLISLLVLAVALGVVVRAARMRALATAPCVGLLGLLGIAAGAAARMPWLAVLAFFTLVAAFALFIRGLVTLGRPKPAQALPPPWGPPAKEDTPGWRPEGAPAWRPKDPS